MALPLFSVDHRKNISTCSEAVMMDRTLFPTHFNEMKLWGVLVTATGEPAAAVHGTGRQVARFTEQDMQALYFKTKANCAGVSAFLYLT